jgi:hypothetical protein
MLNSTFYMISDINISLGVKPPTNMGHNISGLSLGMGVGISLTNPKHRTKGSQC